MVDRKDLKPGIPIRIIADTAPNGFFQHGIALGSIYTIKAVKTVGKSDIIIYVKELNSQFFSTEIELVPITNPTIQDIKKHLQL